jgi:hypothetical protein
VEAARTPAQHIAWTQIGPESQTLPAHHRAMSLRVVGVASQVSSSYMDFMKKLLEPVPDQLHRMTISRGGDAPQVVAGIHVEGRATQGTKLFECSLGDELTEDTIVSCSSPPPLEHREGSL